MSEAPENTRLLMAGRARRRDKNEYRYVPLEATAEGALKIETRAAPDAALAPRGFLPALVVVPGANALQVQMGEAASTPPKYHVAYASVSASSYTESSATGSVTTSPSTMVAAPVTGTTVLVGGIAVCNVDTIRHTITIFNGGNPVVSAVSLSAGQTLLFTQSGASVVPQTGTPPPGFACGTNGVSLAVDGGAVNAVAQYVDVNGASVVPGISGAAISTVYPSFATLLAAATGRYVYSVLVCNNSGATRVVSLNVGGQVMVMQLALLAGQNLAWTPNGLDLQPEVWDHGQLSGLADDDHSQYLLLLGRVTGQTAYGGTAASDKLTLRGTTHATVGRVDLKEILLTDAAGDPPNTGDFFRNGNALKFRTSVGVERLVSFADGTPALGDTLYRGATQWANLAGNITATQKFLAQTGTGSVSAAPSWQEVPGSIVAQGLSVPELQTIPAGVTLWLAWGTADFDTDGMIAAPVNLTGTVAKNASTTVTGTGTLFTTELSVGDTVRIPGGASEVGTVASITNNTQFIANYTYGYSATGQVAQRITNRITFNHAGIYLVHSRFQQAVNHMYVEKNGSLQIFLDMSPTISSTPSFMYSFAAGDYIRLGLDHSVTVDVTGSPRFSVARLSL